MTLGELAQALRTQLATVTEDPAFEAACLLEDLLQLTPQTLRLQKSMVLTPAQVETVQQAARQRQAGVPLQYLLGQWPFMALQLRCGPGVLIPREDTAVLVETAAAFLQKQEKPQKGLDLCAGTGAVSLMTAKWTGATVFAVEKFPAALSYLEQNCRAYDTLPVTVCRGDILLPETAAAFPDGLDFILSNPPYIASAEIATLQKEVQQEPRTALDGGADGLLFYRAICALWAKKLRPGGLLAVEIGETQGAAVAALFSGSGFRQVQVLQDLSGLDRVVRGEYAP